MRRLPYEMNARYTEQMPPHQMTADDSKQCSVNNNETDAIPSGLRAASVCAACPEKKSGVFYLPPFPLLIISDSDDKIQAARHLGRYRLSAFAQVHRIPGH